MLKGPTEKGQGAINPYNARTLILPNNTSNIRKESKEADARFAGPIRPFQEVAV